MFPCSASCFVTHETLLTWSWPCVNWKSTWDAKTTRDLSFDSDSPLPDTTSSPLTPATTYKAFSSSPRHIAADASPRAPILPLAATLSHTPEAARPPSPRQLPEHVAQVDTSAEALTTPRGDPESLTLGSYSRHLLLYAVRGPRTIGRPRLPTSTSASARASIDNTFLTKALSVYTVPQIVMAEQITHDVVKEAQSMGGSPIDVHATTTNDTTSDGDAQRALPPAKSSPPDTAPENATSTSESKHELANGDAGQHSASDDLTAHQTPGESSGGSDTEISRPGSVDQAKERTTEHSRTGSTKRPAAFKSVSVTKAFLAKSAVSTPTARPGEKPTSAGQTSAAAQPVAKPRLVAKSGSGIGNVPRSSLSKTNGAGSGPDASKVWNKNQPVPPQPPKQFTDEELKQQYGIHLATRLQADDSGKEAKWADIDDDEDDWAPETVQWMDGTKSTVAPVAEDQPPPPAEPKPSLKRDPPAEMEKTPAPAVQAPVTTPVTISQRPSSTGGTKTILKPGSHAQAGSGKTNLVLKGQPEKPTLVAKPSSNQVKSPWAPLPPVEKVSPLAINPPVQQSQAPRSLQRDSHGYDAMPPPHMPAREIAPDDFNRTWRDDRGNRELFNSHSGRYEPVNEMRRGSVRESNSRQQPSVLQRPSQDGGPAEPSAAFQTSRNSGDAPAWGRRRNSSNVSGGSIGRMPLPMDRRPADAPSLPLNIQRRGSHSINGADHITPDVHRQPFAQKGPSGDAHHTAERRPSFAQKPSPNVANAQPVSPFGSASSVAPQEAVATPLQMPIESVVEVQNRLMREKLEHARQMKQKEREEEERKEAEKKERLRKKLEAMGLGDDSKSKSKEQSAARAVEKSPQKEKAVPAQVQSPPKPPVPTAEGEVAQYGMMKVHQAHPVKKQHHPEAAASKSPRGTEPALKPSSSPVKAKPEVQPTLAPSLAPSLPELPAPPPSTFTHDNRSHKSPAEQAQTQVQRAEGDARSNNQALKTPQATPAVWTPTPLVQQPRHLGSTVWGPPQTRDRALGNGTFDSNYNRGQPSRPGPSQLPPQLHSGQAPTLGLNPPLNAAPSQPQGVPKQPFVQQPMFGKGDSMAVRQHITVPNPGPIAPPPKSSWSDFANVIRMDDQALREKSRQERERMGNEPYRPEIHETYTNHKGKSQTTLHEKIGGGPAVVNGIKPEMTQAPTTELRPRDEVIKPVYGNTPAAIEGPAMPPVISQGVHLPPSGPASRSSRFFPRPADATATSSAVPSKAESLPPPPPETQSHPAYTCNVEHPVVRLPRIVRVRLPPPVPDAATHSDAPVTMPRQGPRNVGGAQPLVVNPEWQARFNSLLSPVPMPVPRASAVAPPPSQVRPGAVAASSKAPLEVRENFNSATVSLPSTVARRPFVDDGNQNMETRSSAEEILLEEREFGSLPVVKAPKVPHLAANEPPVGFPVNRLNSRFQRPLDVMTKPAFFIGDYDRNSDSIDVKIRLESMRETVTRSMAKKRENRRGPGHKGPKRNFTTNNAAPNANQNQRPRKPLNNPAQASTLNSTPRPSGGNGWTGNRTPSHNNSSWARRAAPSAPVH